jgi:competence protein ComGC
MLTCHQNDTSWTLVDMVIILSICILMLFLLDVSLIDTSKLWRYSSEEPVPFRRQSQAEECSCWFGAMLVVVAI